MKYKNKFDLRHIQNNGRYYCNLKYIYNTKAKLEFDQILTSKVIKTFTTMIQNSKDLPRLTWNSKCIQNVL